ncbi:hypothetical protein IDM48_08935 [Rothia amarae]|uniref:Uncharacterized protein n=1 Tax=Rothia amarae TaxID=169480 RepID=A0A7H2BIJ8_9MICC|nr:hypothetical protein [Rothia amarae]QNV39494.1 hypothetical protein IDM48_08935 [Rothia amarae]SIK50591.1 Uncharacterised protein [Mycobacteroides abscessus subsp. abscessus]
MIHPLLASTVIVAADATQQQYNQDGSPTGSPGIMGFIITLILGIGIILLMLDMTRRARRLRYRNEYAMAREAEERARALQEQEGSVSVTTADDLKNLALKSETRENFHL